ncbi:acetyl-CoA synthetase-like protein [Basidiobolus meristosporus CBS 931.73]|uniref:Long-chain-fatty-acid--CoA ligase n=1 Tax=Basidiobolus meristosporus CBS 931.73 TaxID=1314790 RepID=A0A1Y1Z2T6_9FUNG|nr:acetyl-CoA synthetase-like protein [Basidiobolus meristosporus CBS 931.73]|eukprot:ORY04414.1 acetyl-CoA synthetase-like protein [Basidiobolus meristosporus CBS 931.73]
MSFDLVSYILLAIIGLFVFLSIRGGILPDIHPFILNHQSDTSPVRNEGETTVYRNRFAGHHSSLMSTLDHEVKTIYDLFHRGRKIGSKFLGHRINENGPYQWESYESVYQRIVNFGSGLLAICGLKPKQEQPLGVFMRNCAEWIVADLAIAHYSLVCVPLYDTLDFDAINFIINQTALTTIVVSVDTLPRILGAIPSCPTLKNLIITESSVEEEYVELAKKLEVNLLPFSKIESIGSEQPQEPCPPDADDLAIISYTSGTTGKPKGAMLTHKNIVSVVSSFISSIPKSIPITKTERHLSYLPLAHVFERIVYSAVMYVGASVGFYRGDILKLFEDAYDLQPTVFISVPRILNRFYEKVNDVIQQTGGMKSKVYDLAYSKKRALLKQGILRNDTIWDRLVFSKISSRLGGKVKLVVSGSAPISPHVLEFLRISLGCQVLEGYGQTESSAVITLATIFDYGNPFGRHVGVPIACNEVKLIDVPEMAYSVEDKPNPRGELCVRGNNVMKGYFKQPDETAKVLDKDGWLRTGDIASALPNGTFQIIDRKNFIFKLSQGEFVAPEKIESIYENSVFVQHIFVYGDPLKSYLVAIVVPEVESLIDWAKDNNVPCELASLCQSDALNTMIHKDLVRIGREYDLLGYEQVKKIHLHSEPFSTENNLLTPSFKLRRTVAKQFFAETIQSLYG